MKNLSIETLCAQALHAVDQQTGAVTPSMHLAVTFARDDSYGFRSGHMYSRYGTPTTDIAEDLLAAIDGAASAVLFASGMDAIRALFSTVVSVGGHIALPDIMYFGAQVWLTRESKRGALEIHWYDPKQTEQIEVLLKEHPIELVWVETPANPTFDVVDIAKVAEIAHAHGAFCGVDSTCAPPCTTRPLALGADFCFQSATKYLNGHSDVTAGVVSAREEQTETMTTLRDDVRRYGGGILSGFESWLLIRGMRTMPLRFRQASDNAMRIARHFEHHAKIETVLYPGLSSHAGHEIACRQMTGGFSGMMSLCVKGGFENAKRLATRTQLFVPATSLGGVESLIEHRKAIEGPDSAVADNLVRLSVGIEHVDDLISDIEQALN